MEQNGIVEWHNRYLLEGIRSIVAGTKIPKFLWEDATRIVNYIHNRIPTKAVKLKIPEKVFSGAKPSLSHLWVFGCIAYCHISYEKKNKLEPKAVAMLFLEYDEENKAYHCWNHVTQKIIISRDVRFDGYNFDLKIAPPTKALIEGFHFKQEDSIPQVIIKKFRLIAMGNKQRDGTDYKKTFAPVIKWTTIRTIVALAATNQ